jgi:hypothetical protein
MQGKSGTVMFTDMQQNTFTPDIIIFTDVS